MGKGHHEYRCGYNMRYSGVYLCHCLLTICSASNFAASSASTFLTASCSFFCHQDSSSHLASFTIRSATALGSKAHWSFWEPSCLESKSSAKFSEMGAFLARYVEISLGGMMKQQESLPFSTTAAT